jgi:hypothetical protein
VPKRCKALTRTLWFRQQSSPSPGSDTVVKTWGLVPLHRLRQYSQEQTRHHRRRTLQRAIEVRSRSCSGSESRSERFQTRQHEFQSASSEQQKGYLSSENCELLGYGKGSSTWSWSAVSAHDDGRRRVYICSSSTVALTRLLLVPNDHGHSSLTSRRKTIAARRSVLPVLVSLKSASKLRT